MLCDIGTQPVETARLLLRRFTPADAEEVFENWAGDPAAQLANHEPVYGCWYEVRRLLEKYVGAYGQPGFYQWAVVEKASGRCIGQAAYSQVCAKNRSGEIECRIGRAFQGRGCATEAVGALLAFGFERLALHRIQAGRNPANTAARRVIEKCGFLYEGVLRDFLCTGEGEYEDRMYYSLLEGEWRTKPPADRE